MLNTPYEIKNGYVMIPEADYAALVEQWEDMQDEAALDHALANTEEFFPEDVLKRFVNNNVWQDPRGLIFDPKDYKKVMNFAKKTAEIIEKNGIENTDSRLVKAAEIIKEFGEEKFKTVNPVAFAFYDVMHTEKKTPNPFNKK